MAKVFDGAGIASAINLRLESGGGIVIAPAMREKVRSALNLWLSGFSSENTRRAYGRELSAFAAFAGHEDPRLPLRISSPLRMAKRTRSRTSGGLTRSSVGFPRRRSIAA